jgi:hypothetical protein
MKLLALPQETNCRQRGRLYYLVVNFDFQAKTYTRLNALQEDMGATQNVWRLNTERHC